jgi:hypothetical protein
VQSLLFWSPRQFPTSDHKTLFCGVLDQFAGIQQECSLFGA